MDTMVSAMGMSGANMNIARAIGIFSASAVKIATAMSAQDRACRIGAARM